MRNLDLTDQSSYTYWCEDKIRFADLDTYGHLNNVAYATFAESGRVDFLSAVVENSHHRLSFKNRQQINHTLHVRLIHSSIFLNGKKVFLFAGKDRFNEVQQSHADQML